MVERNTVIGISFLTVGAEFMFGYIIAHRFPNSILAQGVQSPPIASLAVAISIIGAVILLIVPEPVPREEYKALLGDAVKNVEVVLEESAIREKAYFLTTEDDSIRAFIPFAKPGKDNLVKGLPPSVIPQLGKGPVRFVVDYGGVGGYLLVPPGVQLIKLAGVKKGGDLEEELRLVLVEFSDLASSVLAVEAYSDEGSKIIVIQIRNPIMTWESPFLNSCLGSSVSCIASCVTAYVKGRPVKFVDETISKNPASVRISLEIT